MQKAGLLTAILAALITTTALTQTHATDAVTGRWDGQRQAEERVDNIGLVFTQTDKGLTGEVLLNDQVFDQMSEIVVGPNTVAFSAGGLRCAGTIDGKTMRLTAHFQDRDLWTMSLTKKDKG